MCSTQERCTADVSRRRTDNLGFSTDTTPLVIHVHASHKVTYSRLKKLKQLKKSEKICTARRTPTRPSFLSGSIILLSVLSVLWSRKHENMVSLCMTPYAQCTQGTIHKLLQRMVIYLLYVFGYILVVESCRKHTRGRGYKGTDTTPHVVGYRQQPSRRTIHTTCEVFRRGTVSLTGTPQAPFRKIHVDLQQ